MQPRIISPNAIVKMCSISYLCFFMVLSSQRDMRGKHQSYVDIKVCLANFLGFFGQVDFWSSSEHLLEVAIHSCSSKNVLLKISQNSQENTCDGVFFLIKQQPTSSGNFI